MNESRIANPEKVRTRRLAIAATAMLLLAGGVFGGLFYLQRQATLSSMSRDRQVAQINARLEPQAGEVEQRVAHLEKLREKWRPWALQHKELLKKTLHAQPNDEAAMMALYDALPTWWSVEAARKFGGGSGGPLGRWDLDPPGEELDFSWQMGGKLDKLLMVRSDRAGHAHVAASKQKEHDQIQQKRMALLRANFKARRDVALSRSFKASRFNQYLWASGRITQTERDSNLNEGPHKEIEPPYDFLQ